MLGAIWVVEFKTWYPAYFGFGMTRGPAPVPHSACIHTSLMCTSVTPGWALPVGLAIGVIGVLCAALLYGPLLRRKSGLAQRAVAHG